MEDVPHYIWNRVYQKWSQVYLDEWNEDEMWGDGCDLCEYLDQENIDCEECPLRCDKWCCDFGTASRLSGRYYDVHNVDHEWEDGIRDFLVFLKVYCSEE